MPEKNSKQNKPAANKPKTVKTAPESAAKKKTETPAAKKAPSPAAAQPTVKSKGIRTSSARHTVKKYKARKSTARARRSAPSHGKSGGGIAAAFASTKVRIIAAAIAAVLILGIVLGLVFGLRNKISDGYAPIKDKVETIYGEQDIVQPTYDAGYKSATTVGYSARIVGAVTRNIPSSSTDEGLSSGYPTYGKTLSSVIGTSSDKKAERSAIIAEANYLCATGTKNAGAGGGYTKMDANGYLYNGDEPALDKKGHQRRLYKHTASVGLYLGNVSDSEQAVIKEITMRPRGYSSYGITGLYAPAGEVVKITMSEADMNATGGITVHIGQALYNGQANNIWTDKNQMQRMPVILNTMQVNKTTATLSDGVYTAYVGSYLGGPIYIRNTSATFTATISGGVPYSHFILGYTTKEEFEQNAKSSAPYFDLEVWNYGVLHSGPKHYAQNFSFDDLYKVAVLWDKVACVTTTGSNQGVVFLYDPFVAAGAAVAFPGRSSVNCPAGWMTASLNYDGIVKGGSWGNFHEYHHNFQGYGVGGGGEVTNNGMTLVSYALFTKISAARGLNAYGGAGLSGWNCYTSATWALDQIMRDNPSNGKRGLALYATLLHNFGPDAYIQAKYRQRSKSYGENYLGYLKAWQDITHNNMSYYFNEILGAGLTPEALEATGNADMPMFVPVSCVYQTGRGYSFDGEKKFITTMQPYEIPYNAPFTIDLNKYTHNNGQYVSGSVMLPEGFSYTVKSVSDPEYGKIEKTGADGIYTYTPDPNKTGSGKITVTLSITKDDGAFEVGDTDITLGFNQTRENDKNILERTTYTYADGSGYTDAIQAYNNNYAGYASKTEGNNVNKTQNCNTDIWYTNKDGDDAPNNGVVELKGKIYVDEDAKYRIALRGRWNVALFVSLNGGRTYEQACKYVQNGTSDYVFPSSEGTYKDYELRSGDWVYFKAVMITGTQGSRASFIGVGWGKFTPELVLFDEEDNVISRTPESISVSYASAYRGSYEFPDTNFETDYFYRRNYNYSYTGDTVVVTNGLKQTYMENLGNYVPWEKTGQEIENLVDGSLETSIHFSSAWGVSQNKPAILAFDLGTTITANSMTMYKYTRNGLGNRAFPSILKLEISDDGETFTQIGSWTGVTPDADGKRTLTFDNNRTYSFRYYRVTVTATVSDNGGRVALDELTFENTLRLIGNGNNFFSPDNEMFSYKGDWSGKQTQSSFGHVYVGQENATVSFEFTGTRLGILSSSSFGKNYQVIIDGETESCIELKNDPSAFSVSYLSRRLQKGKHTVVIKCLGEANIDSIITYDE